MSGAGRLRAVAVAVATAVAASALAVLAVAVATAVAVAVAVLAVLAVAAFLFGAPPAGAASVSAPTIGPVQINALGRPSLCWEAGGNGSTVTLEHCDAAVQGQQWSLTSDGVLMNGNGYCLEAPAGQALYIDFAAQCAGAGPGTRGQVWRYRSGQLVSAGTAACAAAGGPFWPGTEIVKHACPTGPPQWSIGYSAVTLTPGTGAAGTGSAGSRAAGGPAGSGAVGGPAGSGAAAGPFGASVTVANAASAQTAYGVAVTFSPPPHPTAAAPTAAAPRVTAPRVTGLRVTGGGAGWSCDVRSLTCTGTLPAGISRRIAIEGQLPADSRPSDSYTVVARTSITGTSQRPGTARTTADLAVAVHAALPGVPGAPSAPASRSPLPLVAIIVGVLILGGAVLLLITRRTRAPARHSLPR